MRTTNGNDRPGADAQRFTKLKTLMHRWQRALVNVRGSLRPSDRRRRVDVRRRGRSASGAQLTQVAHDRPEPIRPDPPVGDGAAGGNGLVPLPSERSQALAVLCDRLLSELDGAEVNAAEIRFVVHKNEHSSYPRLEPEAKSGTSDGELVWELRRLIAGSGGTIADVAHALETRGADLDEAARELLRDEVAALEVDLATLNVSLADPVDWDGEFGCLLAGEVAPFDDLAGDEDDENDA
jgi:hypothetical protein